MGRTDQIKTSGALLKKAIEKNDTNTEVPNGEGAELSLFEKEILSVARARRTFCREEGGKLRR